MQGLSYRLSKDYLVYDPLQKCNYRIVDGIRVWLQPRPQEFYTHKKKLNSNQLHLDL